MSLSFFHIIIYQLDFLFCKLSAQIYCLFIFWGFINLYKVLVSY